MSAILGRVHFCGEAVDREAFGSALATLDHYGREGPSLRAEGAVAFGFQRLDIAPTSTHEDQPLVDDHLLIVADAILDNRESLCDQLSIEARWRAQMPDSRLLLLAYRRWGRECVERLVGDFAFVVWDAREQVLFCARDHIGSRPLYYYRVGERFLFATDIRAIYAFRDLSLAIDESRVAGFLLWPHDPSEASFFQDVHPLPPGHWLRVERHGATLQAYWQPLDVPSIRYSRREEYTEHFKALLELAVGDRLNTRYPVGSHLSGGLDSSGVTILASQLMRAGGEQLDMSYSWSPPVSAHYPLAGSQRDERQVIDDICRREVIQCHYGTTTGREYRDYLTRDIALDGTTDLFEEWGVMSQAARRSTRVMLSGWGGDESATFDMRGYPGYLLKRGQWLRLLSIARVAAGGFRHPGKLARFLWQDCLLTFLPDALYARYGPYLRPDQLEQFYRPDFIARFPGARDQRMPAWRVYPDPMAMQALLLQNGHLASRMSTWAHWSAAKGMVYRYPLTDRRLLRFTMGLPPELLWHQGQARSLYRDALGHLLPRQLGKNDNANEKKRMNIRGECWQLLAEEAAKGRFQQGCDWLAMPALQARLLDSPEQMTSTREMLRFLPLCSALQVWHLWQRYMLTH